jgi:cell fate (sporulation/competence/biofilm development) regulator YlbF (YheA/YmcA/DUF963 family)
MAGTRASKFFSISRDVSDSSSRDEFERQSLKGDGMLEEKAKELGRLIGQSPEYQALKRSSEALNEDRESVTLLQQMEKLRGEAQQLIQRGENPTPEMEEQLDSMLEKIQSQTAYQRAVAAQENFDKIMLRVNQWIMDGMKKGATSSIITLG